MAISLLRNENVELRTAGGKPVNHFDHKAVTQLPHRAGHVSAEWDEPMQGEPSVSELELAMRADPVAAQEGYNLFTSLIGGGSSTFRKG